MNQLGQEVGSYLCGDFFMEYLDDARLTVICDDVLRTLDETKLLLNGVRARGASETLISMLVSTQFLLISINDFRERFVEWKLYACSHKVTADVMSFIQIFTSKWLGKGFFEEHNRLVALMDKLRPGLAYLLRVYSLVADCSDEQSQKEHTWMEDICVSLKLMYSVHLPRLDQVADILSTRQVYVALAESHRAAFAQTVQERLDKGYSVFEDMQDCLDENFTGNATLVAEFHIRYWTRLLDHAEAHLVPLWNFLEIRFQEHPIDRIPREFRGYDILQDSRPIDVEMKRDSQKWRRRCRWFTPWQNKKYCQSSEEANEKIEDWDFTISPGCTVTTITMTAVESPKPDAFWYGETLRTTEHHTAETVPAGTAGPRTLG